MTAGAKLVLGCVLALAVAGCKAQPVAEGKTAVSEVLPGSASDAMIPYDTLRSQPPLAPEVQGSDAAVNGPGRSRGASDADQPENAPSAAASDTTAQASGDPPAPPSSGTSP